MAGGGGTKYLGSAFIIEAAAPRIERDEQERAMTTAAGATDAIAGDIARPVQTTSGNRTKTTTK